MPRGEEVPDPGGAQRLQVEGREPGAGEPVVADRERARRHHVAGLGVRGDQPLQPLLGLGAARGLQLVDTVHQQQRPADLQARGHPAGGDLAGDGAGDDGGELLRVGEVAAGELAERQEERHHVAPLRRGRAQHPASGAGCQPPQQGGLARARASPDDHPPQVGERVRRVDARPGQLLLVLGRAAATAARDREADVRLVERVRARPPAAADAEQFKVTK